MILTMTLSILVKLITGLSVVIIVIDLANKWRLNAKSHFILAYQIIVFDN
jgi:hypothetical protein